MRVMIDPGHGGKDSGAVGFGRTEKADVLRLSMRVGEILQANGVQVGFTRTTDIYETPYTKARKGNDFRADFFASIHRNSAASQAAGFETLVFKNSGRAKAAADYANSHIQSLGYKNRGTKIRPDLIVLNSTWMEAVLFEVGFISNQGDNALFDKTFEAQAQALAGAVLTALGMSFTVTPKPAEPKPVAPPKKEDQFIDVAYQVYTDRWLPIVHSMNDFAGIENVPIKGIRIWTVGKQSEVGNVKYRVHLKGRPADQWLDWMIDKNPDKYGDTFAGNLKTEIDAIQAVLINCPGRKIQYRTSRTSDNNYYAFVTNTENEGGYAGVYGKPVDKLQCRIL